MAKSDVTLWDTTSANNSDVGGVNIAEGCPAAGINDAIRTVMSQIATWIVSAAGPLLKTGGTMTGDVTLTYPSSIKDAGGSPHTIGYRNLPLTAKSSSFQIDLPYVGQGISTTAGITVPPNSTTAFAIGDTIVIYNNSASAITITQGTGVTLRLVATASSGNRSLAQRGICSLIKVGTDEWVASGSGVS